MLANNRSSLGVKNGSGIRAMFELGITYRKQGKKPIDLSIGNPDIKPPAVYYETLQRLVSEQADLPTNPHKYMPNPGYAETREVIARDAGSEMGIPLTAADIVMTVGAANAIDVVLMTIIEPGAQDEVIIISPYFVEYNNYIENNRGVSVVVPATNAFDLDLAAIEKALTPQTRALILNSPNNPTGKIYRKETLTALADILRNHNQTTGQTIIVLEDAPYDKIIFGNQQFASMLGCYPHTIYLTSFSKSLGLAGERIGFLAMHPEIGSSVDERQVFQAALATNLRTRVVNAPALQQKAIEILGLKQTVPVEAYGERVEQLAATLQELGFPLVKPEGAFYLFPQLPERFKSEEAFRTLAHAGDDPLLYTPGIYFGGKAYARHIRFSACANPEDITRACKKLQTIMHS